MTTTILTSREFNQDTGRAKRAALEGPVFITDRGNPSYVLVTVEEYRRLQGEQNNIAELLCMPNSADIEFSPEPICFNPKPVDLP